MQFYWLTVGTLAVWRLTHLLQAEDGPWDVIVRLRRMAGTGFWGGALDCFQCLSVWIAAPFALWLGHTWGERLLLWLALSAGAILLERIPESPSTVYFEGEDDVMLRREEKGGQLGARESSRD